MILGGHTHDGVPAAIEVANGGGKTLVTNAGSNGKFLGVLDLEVKGSAVTGYRYRLLPVFSNLLPADAEMAALIAKIPALGAKEIEDGFLSRVDEAKDGKGLVDALGPLALMGTPRSLKAIAVRLRTPLTIIIPTVYEKSVRLNVLEALLYNFPDQPVLYPNNIITEEDSEFLILPSRVLKGLAQKYPALNVMLHTLIGERLSQTELPRGTSFDQQLLRELRTSQPDAEEQPIEPPVEV